MLRRILHFFRLAPLSDLRASIKAEAEMHHELVKAQTALCTLEAKLWDRYQMRLKNDVHMSLSWFYTEHTRRVSLGTAAPNAAAENWPYYPNAQLLLESPRFAPERMEEGPATPAPKGPNCCCKPPERRPGIEKSDLHSDGRYNWHDT